MKTPTKLNQCGNAFVHVLIGLVVLVAIGITGWRIYDLRNSKKTDIVTSNVSSTKAVPASAASATAQTTTSNVPIASGTDNASLSGDLKAISGSLNQESQSSASATASINDQQNEIQVPTN
ncbi:MAG TPA: hypothetical protein VMR08_00280 [Patescibacteria group bacterium]|jgi:hypothetical protein|nr:hypothetical protein [Patescibacteria group bacterium]